MSRQGLSEICDEAWSISGCGVKFAVLTPDGVEGADAADPVVGLIDKGHCGLLVRKGDVYADVVALAEFINEVGQLLGWYRLAGIGPVDAILLEPIAVDQRGA